jgi:fatty acid-binding protein DegV
MDSLKMLVKSGRISKASEFFASLGRMKPMIITENGENVPLCRVISLKNAKKRAVEEILTRVNLDEEHTMMITHADSIEDAKEIEVTLKSKMKISKSFINYMTPVVGSRVGLGGILISVIPDKKL